VRLLREVQAVARLDLHEIEHFTPAHFDGRDPLGPMSIAELVRRLQAGNMSVIDVRPEIEYAAGHVSTGWTLAEATGAEYVLHESAESSFAFHAVRD